MEDTEANLMGDIPWARVGATTLRVGLYMSALVALYAAAPVDTQTTAGAIVVMALAGVGFTLVFAHHLRALRHTEEPVLRAAVLLITTLVVFILGFAITYLALWVSDPSSFSEPLNKISAVYFTVSVLATVGFGDIAATSNLTRAVVTFQMLSGITLLGVLARFVVSFTSFRVKRLRSDGSRSAG